MYACLIIFYIVPVKPKTNGRFSLNLSLTYRLYKQVGKLIQRNDTIIKVTETKQYTKTILIVDTLAKFNLYCYVNIII